MTCIAAKINRHRVTFAWESAVTQGECLIIDSTPKVIPIGSWGPVGGSGAAATIATGFNVFGSTSNLERLVERIHTTFRGKVSEDESSDWLFFHQGSLVTVENGGACIKPSSPFWAIGGGSWLALGAMEAGASARRAVEISCKYHNGCYPPVHTLVWDTKKEVVVK